MHMFMSFCLFFVCTIYNVQWSQSLTRPLSRETIRSRGHVQWSQSLTRPLSRETIRSRDHVQWSQSLTRPLSRETIRSRGHAVNKFSHDTDQYLIAALFINMLLSLINNYFFSYLHRLPFTLMMNSTVVFHSHS